MVLLLTAVEEELHQLMAVLDLQIPMLSIGFVKRLGDDVVDVLACHDKWWWRGVMLTGGD